MITNEPAVGQNEETATAVSTQPVADTSSTPENVPDAEPFDPLDSLTRIAIGEVVEGAIELVGYLQQWEAPAREEAQTEDQSDETIDDMVGYAIVGLLFVSQRRVRRYLPMMLRFAGRTTRLVRSAIRPFVYNPLTAPLRRRGPDIRGHAEGEVERWIAIGRRELPVSRILARHVTADIIDDFIARLAENPEVEILVQQQSAGLVSQVTDGLREQTVTADTAVERIARTLLRRPPRAQVIEVDENNSSMPRVSQED